jgi:hypothetical protein
MISGVIEWRFDCDEASKQARETFDKVMNRDWLREHGIGPFDDDGAWQEVMKQLTKVTNRSPVTIVRLREAEANPCWDLLWQRIFTGGENEQ